MRLINTATLKVEAGHDWATQNYAILSHTWGEDEISLQQLQSGTAVQHHEGYRKVKDACRVALAEGWNYMWIDTCCIDKTSSAELSEAINSMFRWYRNSGVCYAYLSDLNPAGDGQDEFDAALARCRWFSRGWTLQELIAPVELRFYDSGWNPRGTKGDLAALLRDITGIRKSALDDADELYCIPVAEKMSWAARRTTTRIEDAAYCLLGIFDINMPLLYGENARAFRRLQEEILRKTNDMSLLAWAPTVPGQELREIWARGAHEFSWIAAEMATLTVTSQYNSELEIMSKGLRVSTLLLEEPTSGKEERRPRESAPPYHADVLDLGCYYSRPSSPRNFVHIGILLRKFGPFLYVRDMDGRPSAADSDQQSVCDACLVRYPSQYRDEYSMRANRHRWQTIWLHTEDNCVPFWAARRPEAVQQHLQRRFYREFGNYGNRVEDAKGTRGCDLLRDIHFPQHPGFLRPPRAVYGDLWNCATRTVMVGWETRRPWEAVMVSFGWDCGPTPRDVLVICYRLAHDPWLFLVDVSDPLGQQVLDAGRSPIGQMDEQLLEAKLVGRYWNMGGHDGGSLNLDLAPSPAGRWRIHASRSDGIVAGISPTREVSSVTFRFTRLS